MDLVQYISTEKNLHSKVLYNSYMPKTHYIIILRNDTK